MPKFRANNSHIPTPTPPQKVHGFTRFMRVTFKISEGSEPPEPPVSYLSGHFEIFIRYHNRLTRASDIWHDHFQYLDSLFRSVTFIIILFITSCDNSCALWLVGAANWTQQISIKTNYFVIPRPSFLRPLDVTFLRPRTQEKKMNGHMMASWTRNRMNLDAASKIRTYFQKNAIIWPGHYVLLYLYVSS